MRKTEDGPAIAVCIPTRDRSERLKQCLDSIRTGTVQPHVIVVSDDSSSEIEREKTRVVAEECEAVYRVGPKRGVCANRNNALAGVAVASHILFLDDDCTLEDHFIETVEKRIRSLDAGQVSRSILAGREVMPDGTMTVPYRMAFRGFYEPSGRPEIGSCKATIYPAEFFTCAMWNEDVYFGCEDADLSFQAVKHQFRFIDCEELKIQDRAPALGVLARDESNGPSDYDLWVAAGRMHVGLKRYVYYKFRPDLLVLFFAYTNFLLIRTAVRFKSFGYIVEVYKRARLGKLALAPKRLV